MSIALVKLLAYVNELKSAKWSCKYQDQDWQVEGVDIDLKPKLLEFSCTIKRQEGDHVIEHFIILQEHYEGGGDKLFLDRREHDADHDIAVKFRLLPPSTKIKVKTEFDLDDKPGFEEVLYLATKLKVSVL
ncbi:hypothetical protein JW859_11750 [bacterium]|nr:hypothetical protein [bacterium]